MIETARQHGNKFVHGLSAATIIWLYATFPSKNDLQSIRERQAETWRAVQDIQTVLMKRAEATVGLTNATAGITVGP